MSNNNHTSSKRLAHLHWVGDGPCFCNPEIYLDLDKLHPTRETIAAIFGIRNPQSITLSSRDTGETIPFKEDKSTWSLKGGQHYNVDSTATANEEIVPIHQMFQLFPGTTEDEKGDAIHNLSLNFYGKIWKDPSTPKEFRDRFFSLTSSDAIQAFRQYNWLLEVFGGPSMQDHAALLKKVMAKHTSSRMTKQYALTWLQIMKQSIQEEFPNEPKLRDMLGLYWLHFYGFFPYDDEARKEFRQLIIAGVSGSGQEPPKQKS